MAAQPPAPTHFNPYYNNIILHDANGANNAFSIKLIEKANEGYDSKDRFDGKRGTLLTFLKMLERYSRDFDWERLRSITDRNGDNYDLFNHCGQISLDEIILFQEQNIWNVPILRANAGAINQKKLRLTYMFQKISNCCTQRVLNELKKKKHLYSRPNGESDGVVFLKLIMDEYSTKTVYTSRNIIKGFRTIKLADFDNNVQKLHEHLEEEVLKLEALGYTHDHLLMDVFGFFKTSTNADFIQDIKDEEEKYERDQAMDWTDLMDHTVDTYSDMVDKKTWNVKDPRDEKIMSLATIIKRMVAFSAVKPQSENSRNKNRRTFKAIDPWKFLRDNNEDKKTVNGTEFHWCPFHYEKGMWTTHVPGSCGRKDSHVLSVYDKKAHEAQWNTKNKSTSSVSPSSAVAAAVPASANSSVQFQLDFKLESALCSISDGSDFDTAAILDAYGIEDECPSSDTKND